jgi:hypothetical protein
MAAAGEDVGRIADQNGNEHSVRWEPATGKVWISATDDPDGPWLEVDGMATSAEFARDMAGAHLLSHPV